MMTAQHSKITEEPQDALKPLIAKTPYKYLVFERMNADVAVFFVAGVQGGPWNAENALKKSFVNHGGNCFYCDSKLTKDSLTIDHVEGRSGASSDAIQNLVLACAPCNTKKGNRPIEVFCPNAGREWLTALLDQVQARLAELEAATSAPKPKAPTPTSPAATSAKALAR